jgi:hypothetical protein
MDQDFQAMPVLANIIVTSLANVTEHKSGHFWSQLRQMPSDQKNGAWQMAGKRN